jgi:hypothetical protein
VIGRVVAAGALAWGCRGGDPARAQDHATTAADPAAAGDRVVLTGELHPVSAVELALPSTDQQQLAIRWMIDDGAVVKAGDRVLAFDDAPFTNRLQESRAQLRQAELQLQLLHDAGALRVADKQLAVRRQQIARDKARLQAEVPADLLAGRAVQTNQHAVVRAETGLRKAENELAAMVADNQLQERIKQIELDKTRRAIATAEQAIHALGVDAPRDGVIVVDDNPWTGHKFHVGELASDGTPIISLPDLTQPMEVRAELSDVDDGRVRRHMAGTCTLDAYPDEPLPCTVEDLAPVARGREGQDSLRRAFGVTLALAHHEPARLRPGMAVKVELPGERGERGSIGGQP